MAVRVYVGDLGDQGSRSEIERAFSRYGDLADVWVARNPPGFAFVFFESSREAENACRNLDGTELCGVRVRVEIAKGPDKGEKYRGPEKGEKYRSGPTCRECGRIGHGVRDCTRRAGYIYRGKNSEYQIRHYGSRRRSRSRSRSRERGHRRYERDRYDDRRRSRSRSFERRR